MFQNFNLLPGLTAAGNVELPLVYAGVSRRERHDRAMELLGRVGLMDRAGHQLPSCQEALEQRVARRAGTGQRPVHSSGGRADASGQPQRRTNPGSPAGHHQGGRTILIVTHDETVATRAGQVIHLRDGRI